MNDTLSKLLESFPFCTKISVAWGDMDAAQHVNNVTYLRYAETARIRFMDRLDLGWSSDNKGEGVILAWQDCKYIFPVTYPDTVWIGAAVSEIRDDRFFLQLNMFSEKHGRIVAISNHSHVPYNYDTLQKIEMPQQWRSKLEMMVRDNI